MDRIDNSVARSKSSPRRSRATADRDNWPIKAINRGAARLHCKWAAVVADMQMIIDY